MTNQTPVERLKIAFEELRYRGLVADMGDFHEKLGYQRAQVSNIMNGRTPITKRFLFTLQAVFMIDTRYIKGESKGVFIEGYEPPKGLGEGALLRKIVFSNGYSMGTMAEKLNMQRHSLSYHTNNKTVPVWIKKGISKVLKVPMKGLWVE